jgi:hypothetical protein
MATTFDEDPILQAIREVSEFGAIDELYLAFERLREIEEKAAELADLVKGKA